MKIILLCSYCENNIIIFILLEVRVFEGRFTIRGSHLKKGFIFFGKGGFTKGGLM